MHGELDDRAAKLARQRRDTRHQRTRDSLGAIFGFDKKVLQEHHRSIPSGDNTLAAGHERNAAALAENVEAHGASRVYISEINCNLSERPLCATDAVSPRK